MKNMLLIVCLFSLSFTAHAQTGLIFTIAGNGNMGYTGDSGQATQATFSFPDMMVVDRERNIYISDRDNHVIRKVDPQGIITTFAGNGFAGIEGDGGPAIDAEFAAAYGLAFDRFGNLCIADEQVRRIDMQTGIVNTIAGGGTNNPGDGGLATDATMESLQQITFDAVGNLYITDGIHASIRKVDTLGIITTVAGGGTGSGTGDGGLATSAVLQRPEGVAVDAAGNIFIADQQANNIRRVDANTHIITTICGDPAGRDGGFSGDGGPAHLALLQGPNCLAFDAAGNLFVNDAMNEVVREIFTTGFINTIAGEGMFTVGSRTDSDDVLATDDFFRGNYAVSFDPFGNLYIAEADNFKIRIVTLAGTSGVQSVAENTELKCYPNPVHDWLNVESAAFGDGEVSAKVYDLAGQLVAGCNTAVSNTLQFNTHNLAPGMYFINVATGSSYSTVRFVKE